MIPAIKAFLNARPKAFFDVEEDVPFDLLGLFCKEEFFVSETIFLPSAKFQKTSIIAVIIPQNKDHKQMYVLSNSYFILKIETFYER